MRSFYGPAPCSAGETWLELRKIRPGTPLIEDAQEAWEALVDAVWLDSGHEPIEKPAPRSVGGNVVDLAVRRRRATTQRMAV